LVEPFAGGAIVSLTALFERWVEKVVMVELDDEVAAVWEAIFGGDAEWLANRVLTFQMSREAVEAELKRRPATTREKAFQTLLKNRTFHGGILAQGSGLIKHGESGRGIGSRWYPKTLAQRIVNLRQIAARVDFHHDDGLKVMKEFANRPDAVFFIDPPYTAGGKKAGKRLYKHNELDHQYLFSLCQSLVGEFLMTYDEAEEVKEMARRCGFQMRLIPMKNTHNATLREIVIARDLSALDELPSVAEPNGEYSAEKISR
jgi:DNA adenine methylase